MYTANNARIEILGLAFSYFIKLLLLRSLYILAIFKQSQIILY